MFIKLLVGSLKSNAIKFFGILIILLCQPGFGQQITTPGNQNIPANKQNYNAITGTYSLSGYDASIEYQLAITVTGNASATLSINTTTGLDISGNLNFPSSFSGFEEIYFKGTIAEIEAALNSISVSSTSVLSGQIKIQTYIYPYKQNTFFNPKNGHAYEVVANSNISWLNAKSASENTSFGGETGYLVTVTSQDEHDFTYKLDKSYWLGASDADSEGVWEWVTGPEAGTQFWSGNANGSSIDGLFNLWSDKGTDQPNNYGSGEDYAGFYRPDEYFGWRDYEESSGEIYGYVIEYGTSTDTTGMNSSLNNVQASEVTLTQKGFLSDATLEEIPAYEKTGAAITPSLNLTYNGTSLVKDTDYTVSFSNNINVGTASVSITGIGNY